MTDIVERLRDYSRRAFDGYPAPRRDAAEAMSNAADEIERFRAAVKAENEACAKIADECVFAVDAAFEIRARMEAKP